MDASGLLRHQQVSGVFSDIEQSVGLIFRQARERAGMDLAAVAAQTKIASYYLDAIEAMDRASLPQRAYALGFVRCYADCLGLDADEMVRRFRAHFYTGTAPADELLPPPSQAWVDFRLPRGIGIALVSLCALGLATWYGMRIPARSEAAVPAVPEAMADWARSHVRDDADVASPARFTLDGS